MESIARAEVLTPQLSNQQYYLWEVPQKPVAVRISFNVIDRLEKEVVESFRSLTSRGSEVGGILLGAVQPGTPTLVTVEEYEAIPCDYARGPLYRLGDADMGRFERAIEQRTQAGAVVVGFFRSHTRKGLSLDSEDSAFFEARFRQPHQMILLVRPYAAKPSAAGIFIREDERVRGESSYLEFPFRSTQLSAAAAVPPAATPAPAAPAAAAAPAPAAPRPAVRAQIVPIASRREINLPTAAPAVEPPPPPKPSASAAAAPAPETEIKKAETKPPEVKTPETKAPEAKAPEAKKDDSPAAPAPKPAAAVAAAAAAPAPAPAPVSVSASAAAAAPAVSTPAPAVETVQPETKPARSFKPIVVAAIAAVLLLGVILFVYPGILHRGTPVLPGQDSSSLSLRIERTGADILLTWNRDSEAIRNASHAVLSISDGDRHENYDMDLGQLRNGSIVYSPLTSDVSFRMEVTGKGQARTTSESVRVLRTRPSPILEENQTPAQAQTAAAKPNTPAPVDNKPATDPAKPPDAVTDAPAAQPASPTKPFDPSSLSSRLRPAAPTDVPVELPAAPVLGNAGVQAPASVAGVNLTGVSPAAPPPPAPAAAKQAPAAAPTASKAAPKAMAGGQIRQAELISRREPEYPKLARQMGIRGTVELVATIGPDGRVKNVQVIHGHPLLTKAATDAVMQWVYRPTLLNGVPVQNETRITLNFTGAQ